MLTLQETLALIRPNIASLAPYSTARDEYRGPIGVYLDANENPFGGNGVNRYPGSALKERVRAKVAALRGCAPESLFLGNGSDEAIDLCYRIFCTPGRDKAVIMAPSYGMYSVCADINDVAYTAVPLNADFSLPVGRMLAAADADTKLMFVCSPNNPTANAFPQEDLLALAEGFRGILVVDEAYIDFSREPGLLPRLAELPNVIVLQTLSKAFGLAGLRIGLAVAAPEIISVFRQVKYPYNIGTDTLELAERLIDPEKVAAEVRTLIVERDALAKALSALPCIRKVWPSDANFLLVRTDRPRELYDRLLAAGLIVRDRSRVPGCEGSLRITVGTPEENRRIIEEITRYGEEA